jgi:hypothetical protein
MAKRITSLSVTFRIKISTTFSTTIGNVVKLFLKVCSNAKILKYLNLKGENSPPLYGPIAEFILYAISSVYCGSSFIINPATKSNDSVGQSPPFFPKAFCFGIFIFFNERLLFQQLLKLPVRMLARWVFCNLFNKSSYTFDMIIRLLTFKKTFR